MDQNVGTLDRLGRIAVALAIIFVLVRSGKVNLFNAVLLITSGALISSAASGSCALYTHLGISTSEKL
ncbi:MAG: DUF2892 domain-containing protein [Bacteriovoracaceae bacterium]|jgi:hypothetical protein|nr:DUF2892 domain-containing protein [Deltaproteobacteria bacterium]MDI9542484.1 DUF2892 domain-containing protein [Pseudomonadota bacterium]NLW68478.1 DUF2892 domain-containing protein [Bacteriovoracaceae bacterium]HRR22356.1 DUF2892 domain-containing protein [Desulfomonilia bacterium]HNR52312.1 DUF2892 domain-containing protein [Deltaproteobacteria bacterium]